MQITKLSPKLKRVQLGLNRSVGTLIVFYVKKKKISLLTLASLIIESMKAFMVSCDLHCGQGFVV